MASKKSLSDLLREEVNKGPQSNPSAPPADQEASSVAEDPSQPEAAPTGPYYTLAVLKPQRLQERTGQALSARALAA